MSRGRSLGRHRAVVALLVLAAILVAGSVVACTSTSVPKAASVAPASPTRPNIVFVLTDDLATNLLPYMPHVRALQRAGMTFTNYTVTDSLCCPSRASIFTGDFPHTTKIVTNNGNYGGFLLFHNRGEEAHTFAPVVQSRGYRTALMGKYLNSYHASFPAPAVLGDWTPAQSTFVPPGWTDWDAVGFGYYQYGYDLNHDHTVLRHGHAPQDYLNTVLQNHGLDFISDSVRVKAPFLLEIASFSPHAPATPAPQDLNSFADVTAPRGPAFDRLPKNAPAWLRSRPPMDAAMIASIDAAFRQRVRSVQSVDRMIGALEQRLQATGQAGNTVFVFSSDNGYHMGDYRLKPGKLTAFDTDVRVPLIVAGPGIAAGSVNSDVVENVDLAPTFEQLAGAVPPDTVEGSSLVPLLHGESPPWRSLALVEHHGLDDTPGDPDRQNSSAGNPPTYAAIRSPRFTYVRYVTGEREYYDLARDPYELDNLAATLSPARVRQLDGWLDALHTCVGARPCWQAGRPSLAG
jgi:N-acetylglucosamine-6-sulfatase